MKFHIEFKHVEEENSLIKVFLRLDRRVDTKIPKKRFEMKDMPFEFVSVKKWNPDEG